MYFKRYSVSLDRVTNEITSVRMVYNAPDRPGKFSERREILVYAGGTDIRLWAVDELDAVNAVTNWLKGRLSQ